MARLQMLTKNKAHITEQAAAQISTLWACKIEHFFQSMAPGAALTAMSAQVHFATLIEVLMTAIESGMDSAPEIWVERVRSLRRELKLVVERLIRIFSYTTCCSPPSRQKCAISLRKPSTTAWTRGSMS